MALDFSKYCPKDIFTFYGFDHWLGKSPIDSQSAFIQQVSHAAPDKSMDATEYYTYLKQQVSWIKIDSPIENMLRNGDMLRIEYRYQYGKATWDYLFKNEEKALFYFNQIEKYFSA